MQLLFPSETGKISYYYEGEILTATGKISIEEQRQVIDNLIRLVRDYYILPEIGEKMAQQLEKKSKSGGYKDISEVSKLCSTLTGDLQEVFQDNHLAIFQSPGLASKLKEKGPDAEEDYEQWFIGRDISNYGVKRAEYLEGNIGYLDLRLFAPVSFGREAAIAAMKFLEHSDALIFDLRYCEGGDVWQVQLFESYLFDEPPKLLLTFYYRSKDRYQYIYTIPHLPGKRFPNIPVYILTSRTTFSGGEDFAYTMKHHDRAKTVGETTGGGGNTVETKVVHGDIVIVLSTGHPIHPVTESNWEGTGVEPDIPVPYEKALEVAHIHALETLIESNQDPTRASRLDWFLGQVRAKYTPFTIPEERLSKYIGKYRRHDVYLEEHSIIVKDSTQWKEYRLVPLSDTHFAIENDDQYTIRFTFDDNEEISKFAYVHWRSKGEIAFEKL
ncbi:MAG: S41 family peptidase [Candidatus Thorarchaeota archaeon]|jgi:hypothetical protein